MTRCSTRIRTTCIRLTKASKLTRAGESPEAYSGVGIIGCSYDAAVLPIRVLGIDGKSGGACVIWREKREVTPPIR